MRQPQPCCSLRSVNISYVPSARYFQPSCGGLERLSILKWKGERIHCWQRFWKMLAKWGLKVNTERKDDFLNYTSCEQTQSEPGRDRVCERLRLTEVKAAAALVSSVRFLLGDLFLDYFENFYVFGWNTAFLSLDRKGWKARFANQGICIHVLP